MGLYISPKEARRDSQYTNFGPRRPVPPIGMKFSSLPDSMSSKSKARRGRKKNT